MFFLGSHKFFLLLCPMLPCFLFPYLLLLCIFSVTFLLWFLLSCFSFAFLLFSCFILTHFVLLCIIIIVSRIIIYIGILVTIYTIHMKRIKLHCTKGVKHLIIYHWVKGKILIRIDLVLQR